MADLIVILASVIIVSLMAFIGIILEFSHMEALQKRRLLCTILFQP